MRSLLQMLADCLWPRHPSVNLQRLDLNDCLRFLIVVAIVGFNGPEVFLAADMVALLDILGVALFMTAFAVGYRMLGITILSSIKKILFPAEWTVFIKMRRQPSLVAYGIMRIGINVLLISAVCLGVFINTAEIVKKMG